MKINLKKVGKVLTFITLFVVVFTPLLALGQQAPVVGPGPIGDDIFGWTATFLDQISRWLTYVFFVLAIIFLIIAAIMYLVAAGDSEKAGTARRMLIYAIIAIVIALLAWSMRGILQNLLGVVPPVN